MNLKTICFALTAASFCFQPLADSAEILWNADKDNGALTSIKVAGDSRDMNWIISPKLKKFISNDDLWGLGTLVVRDAYGFRKNLRWNKPSQISKDFAIYDSEGVEIKVSRKKIGDDLLETYEFTNTSKTKLDFEKIAVNAPFNDNYVRGRVSLDGRAHAHIWAAGGNSAYVCALNMGANAPHIGLVAVEGSLDGYALDKRSKKTGGSNFRGVISLLATPFSLEVGETKKISWRIFSHSGWDDFFAKAKSLGAVVAKFETPTTVFVGDTVRLSFDSDSKIENPRVLLNGKYIPCSASIFSNEIETEAVAEKVGEMNFVLEYGDGKTTRAVCNVAESPEKTAAMRARFIVEKQQMNDASDPRFGAYMVYDNILEKIYKSDDDRKSPDVDEGAERLGMGIFLARYAHSHPDKKLRDSLLRYADFIRNKLQTPDYKTFSSVDKTGRNRYFNYVWVARFYCELYRLTDDKSWLAHAVGTMRSFYSQFGHAKYTLDTPVFVSINSLRRAKMDSEANELLADYVKTGEIYAANGENYPRQEVNYEQSIVAPAAMHLLELYLITKEKKWLDAAKVQLRILEAFDGRQPDFRLKNVAIRHWDGYWFGKRRFWGDTFPHYWTCLSAMAYSMYADASGDDSFRARAKEIADACLLLFYGSGRASCAYIYPDEINSEPVKIFDEFANDQDWALAFKMMIDSRDY